MLIIDASPHMYKLIFSSDHGVMSQLRPAPNLARHMLGPVTWWLTADPENTDPTRDRHSPLTVPGLRESSQRTRSVDRDGPHCFFTACLQTAENRALIWQTHSIHWGKRISDKMETTPSLNLTWSQTGLKKRAYTLQSATDEMLISKATK